MKRVYVFHSFHFMLQNKRSTDKMFPSVQEVLIGYAGLFILLYLAFFCFEYFFHRVSPFDPGSLVGFGVLGCIGVIGCTQGYWNMFAGFLLCLLGGFIGSGMYRFHENPRDHQERYRAIDGGSEKKAIWKWIWGASSSLKITYFLVDLSVQLIYPANHCTGLHRQAN